MWLSQRKSKTKDSGLTPQVGRVTLEEKEIGVWADGERRELPVFGPGGYHWRPCVDQEVLVLKTGGAGEAPCVAGARSDTDLEPGEVCIRARGGAAITLRGNGTIWLEGKVMINGVPLAVAGETEG